VAIIPLLCPFAWPGIEGLTRAFFKRDRLRRIVATGLLVLVAFTGLARVWADNRERNRGDSRTVAYDWILENLPPAELILVEDDGIPLQPDVSSISRMRRRLAELPQGPFTYHQERRLDLLEKYPAVEARNIDLQGRPWWLPREKTDEEIAQSFKDLDMSNPLTSRYPLSLEEYRDAGVRYVVTTSLGYRWLDAFADPEQRFPAFVRFYGSLKEIAPIKTIDPRERDGKGPVIWIHDLGSLGH
jgi:hypothetical protein